MNKITKILLSLFIATLMLVNGCDDLNNLPLNIPSEPIYFSSTGQNNFSFDDGTTAGLTGDIKLTVREGNANGKIIFEWEKDGLVTANYLDEAIKIELEPEEIADMNTYLENFDTLGDLCFYGSLETSNITGQGPPFTVNAHVIFVIEAIVETSN